MADNSDAAVGSISHILKPAFKDVYEESNLKDAAARERQDINNAKDAQRDRRAARAAAAAAALEAGEEPVDAGAGDDADEGDEENKDGNDEASLASLHTVEAPPLLPNVPNLYDNLASDLLQRQQSIDDALASKITAATELKEYLVTEKVRAAVEEEEEEEVLKKQGIMVGQHIHPCRRSFRCLLTNSVPTVL